MRLILRVMLALFLAASALPAVAHEYSAGSIAIGHPWSRATPPGARNAAGYLTLTNRGETADRLVAATSPAAARTEIHLMAVVDGTMRMAPVPGVDLPAGTTVALEPGGYHVMLMDIVEPFAEGTRIPVTLIFERAGEVDVELAVEAIDYRGPDPSAPVAAHGQHEGMEMPE